MKEKAEKKKKEEFWNNYINEMNLVGFLSEWTAIAESSFATGWCAQYRGTSFALNDRLRVTKDDLNLQTTWTFDIHEVRVWMWNQTL
jgi:hypothetical protein